VAKDQACKLQILSAKHPDLLQAVDAMFDKYATVLAVRRMIEHKYHEDAGETAVSTYKKKHWQVRKDAVMERVTAMKAVAQLVGEDGLTAGVNALLWESLQEMTATQLMAFKKVLNDGAKVALMKKQFALYAQEHRQKMKERLAAEKAASVDTEVIDDFEAAQKVVQQVKEIFGIGTRSFVPPVQKLLGPAEGPRSPE
jgi:hypothetical protein